MNKFGHKTTALNDKIVESLALLTEAEPRYDGDVGPMISRLKEDAGDGAHYRDFWARVVHGEWQEPSEFRQTRRAWYEWTKAVARMTTLVSLRPEELRNIVYADRARRARA